MALPSQNSLRIFYWLVIFKSPIHNTREAMTHDDFAAMKVGAADLKSLVEQSERGGMRMMCLAVATGRHAVNYIAHLEAKLEQTGCAQRADKSNVVEGHSAATAEPTCWNCKQPYTLEQRADADGNCPHCGVEIELIPPTASGGGADLPAHPANTCEHCESERPLHLLTCPVAVKGMAQGKKKEAPEPLRQLLIDLSNNTYFCGLHLADDAKYAGYLAEAEKAEQAIIELFAAPSPVGGSAAPVGPRGGRIWHIKEIDDHTDDCIVESFFTEGEAQQFCAKHPDHEYFKRVG